MHCGGNEGENDRAESASKQTMADDFHDDDDEEHNHPDEDNTDTISEIMECSSDCCKPDHEGPNQPKSSRILAATKHVQSCQARYAQAGWFSQHPWLTLCET